MKFSVQRDSFIRLLSRAQGIVEKKSTVTVLSHILLETVADGRIKLTCTDYDVVLLDSCPATIEREGRVVLSGKALFDIVKVLPSVDISVEKDASERVEISTTNSHFILSGYDPDDFPRIEKADSEAGFTLPVVALRRMLAKTSFCMSQEEVRMNLNGIFFDIQKDSEDNVTFACVATDGHRLAKAVQIFAGMDIPFESKGVIIHRKGIQELRKLLDSEASDVHVGFGAGEVVFRVGSAALFVREIDDDYPDYQAVIPSDFTRQFVVDVPELLDGMKRVSPLVDPNVQTVKMEVRPENLVLSAANAQLGRCETTLFADYEGEPFVVGFNQRYLLDCVTSVESPQVSVRMTEPGAPCLVVPSNPEEGTVFVLMPIDEA
jgi:DNA polymerase-3 subunit beta